MAPYGDYRRKDVRLVLLPPRPKRRMTAFNHFIKAYWKRNTLEPGKYRTGASVCAAAAEWQRLDNITKHTYGLRARDENKHHEKAFQNWMNLRNQIKRPPAPFAIYVKELWEQEKKRKKPRKFIAMNKHIVSSWRKLKKSPSGKNKIKSYQIRHEEAMKQHAALLQSLKNGKEIDSGESDIEMDENDPMENFEENPQESDNSRVTNMDEKKPDQSSKGTK